MRLGRDDEHVAGAALDTRARVLCRDRGGDRAVRPLAPLAARPDRVELAAAREPEHVAPRDGAESRLVRGGEPQAARPDRVELAAAREQEHVAPREREQAADRATD